MGILEKHFGKKERVATKNMHVTKRGFLHLTCSVIKKDAFSRFSTEKIPNSAGESGSILLRLMFPKIGVPPNHPILIGFSIIFTIHFGVLPLFLETPRLMLKNAHRSLCFGGRLLCIVPSLESALYVTQRCEEERTSGFFGSSKWYLGVFVLVDLKWCFLVFLGDLSGSFK